MDNTNTLMMDIIWDATIDMPNIWQRRMLYRILIPNFESRG